jgi:hypothetical protein
MGGRDTEWFQGAKRSNPMDLPYRDELAAARSRIELLERAASEGICVRCATRPARPLRRPVVRAFVSVVLAFFALTIGVLTVTSLVAQLRYTGRGFHRPTPDM